MHLLVFIIASANAGSICSDGTRSSSTGRGTCSHHGGVSRTSYYIPPYIPTYNPPTISYRYSHDTHSRPMPLPPTLCSDGTWSNSEGSGTCSHHGGIFYGGNSSHKRISASDIVLSGPLIIDLVTNKSGQEEWLGELQDNSFSRSKKSVDPNAKNNRTDLYVSVNPTYACWIKDSFGDNITFDCYSDSKEKCKHPLEGTIVNTVAQHCLPK